MIKRVIIRFKKSLFYRETLRPIYYKLRDISQNNKDIRKFKKDLSIYNEMYRGGIFSVKSENMSRCLKDYRATAGHLGGYFWQDLWAARHIANDNPVTHYDIGSSVASFIGHLASFRGNINLIDVRPLDKQIPGVSFTQADATNLDGIEDNSILSLSALCSLEHFGLGRYGDPIDPYAWEKAMKSIQRVLAKGGKAYISVPIGKEKLVFNAHRIFYASTIVETFDELTLKEFVCETDDQLEYMEDIHKYDDDENGRFGMFMFVKE